MQARDLVVGYAACDFRVPVPWIGAIQLGGFNQRMGDGRRCSAYRMLMGWMAPAPTGVAMRHTADVHICS